MVDCKMRGSELDQSMDLLKGRLDDFDTRMREMREHVNIRDRKVYELIDHINKMKQHQAEASIERSRKLAKELQKRDLDISNCNKSIRALDSIISGQRTHLDNLST